MPSKWIVLLEAARDSSAAELETEGLAGLIDLLADVRPVALYSSDRYAVQLELSADSPSDAIERALARWSEAVRVQAAAVWDLVRAEVMTDAERDLEIRLATRNDRGGIAHPAEPAFGIASNGPSDEDRASELRWRLMLQDSEELLTLLSEDGHVLFSVPPPGMRLPQSDGDIPSTLADAAHPDDAGVIREAIAQLLGGHYDRVAFAARFPRDDDWRWYETTARNLLEVPLVRAVVVNGRDMTERKQLEERVAALATHDELTGLVNRAVLLDELELMLARSVEHSQAAVFFVDIDDFRGLVERVGIAVGDRLLSTVAERIKTQVRDAAIAARLGRDEFALACDLTSGSTEATEVAKRIAAVLSEPIAIDIEEVSLSVSIGVALGTSGTVQAATLLRHAEVAMQRARRGRARFEIFRRRRRSRTTTDWPGPPPG